MEIVKSNFTEKLDEIAEAISQASFLAIDGEFTGLDKQGYGHTNPFDTPEERYMKLRESSLDFLLIQFGLCTFRLKEDTQSYEARPFNFYIFPRPYTRQAPDRRFLCQSSSMDFLVQQGFDFNKLFREGIPYLTQMQEDVMRDSLTQKHEAFAKFSSPAFFSPVGGEIGPGKGPILIPDEQKEFIDNTCEKISKFLEDSDGPKVLQLDPCNGFQRKLLYQTVRTKFSAVHLETKTGDKKERFIVVTKVSSDEELKKKEKDKQNAELMELEEAVGFAKVIKLIKESGKTVVGHNMMLDVMHVVNQFLHPLPQELAEFKELVRCCLPRLIDTKHMASTHPLKEVIPNTVLANMQQTLEKEPFTPAKVELPEEYSRYGEATERYHEAGYDAYVTGCMFATMANYIGRNEGNPKPVVEASSSLLEPFLNKLFMMRIADIPYLNLAGLDLQPSRDHVFHLSFPKEWKSSDINNLFGAFGNIHISWINDTSVFVALYKKDNAEAVLKALGETRTLYQLVPYKVYRSSQGESSTVPVVCSPPAPPSITSPPEHRTPRPLKRHAPPDDDVDGDTEEVLQPVGKKLRSAGDTGGTKAAGKEEESKIPEVVPQLQLDNKTSSSEAAEADSTGMFAVPSNW
ncbi:poly(A)-specific ribonuclease PARN-like [Babylonia areolata]|uniref:poly(A)-specific ribonuclease PARN-like n=1 Tax=Babylonia areolata TaxID=304850 RepID=UPI003FD558DE